MNCPRPQTSRKLEGDVTQISVIAVLADQSKHAIYHTQDFRSTDVLHDAVNYFYTYL